MLNCIVMNRVTCSYHNMFITIPASSKPFGTKNFYILTSQNLKDFKFASALNPSTSLSITFQLTMALPNYTERQEHSSNLEFTHTSF